MDKFESLALWMALEISKNSDGDYAKLETRIAWSVWQSRQAEVDQLKNLLEKDEHAHNLYYENANLQTLVEEKDKRIETVLNLLEYPTAEWSETVFLAIQALRGEYE